MKVFVTGATGFVGSAVVRELIGAGHEVVGLVRSDEGAAVLAAMGGKVHRGSLEDHDSLRQGASQAEGVIHTAFNHDFSKFAENGQLDKRAIEAMGEALAGSDRPLVITSGIGLLAPGQLANEDTLTRANHPRKSEQAAETVASSGVRTASIRLPPTVHGEGDHAFIPTLIAVAREKGVSAYIGEGLNHWPAVHRLDAAVLYRLVLEQGAPSPRYHGVAEEGVPFKRIAEAIGRGLDVPAVSIGSDEIAAHFGWFAMFVGINSRASSDKTRDEVSWDPTQADLIGDLDQGHYFRT